MISDGVCDARQIRRSVASAAPASSGVVPGLTRNCARPAPPRRHRGAQQRTGADPDLRQLAGDRGNRGNRRLGPEQ